jgi:hypothetical protein
MTTDLHFALRQLLKTPGFTLLAVITLARGDRAEHRDRSTWLCGVKRFCARINCPTGNSFFADQPFPSCTI